MRTTTLRFERKWMFSLLWVNLSVSLVVLVQMAGNSAWTPNELLHTWAYSLVYANVTGVPAIFVLPRLIERYANHPRLQVLAVVLGCLSFAALGSLLAQILLMATGSEIPRQFWLEYLHTLRAALPLALVFALGAFFYASLRNRLQVAEQKLHARELAEERTQKLAVEARLRSLEARIHPHFLFNTLNSISSLISDNPAEAEETIGRLAGLLRAALDHGPQRLIPLFQELAMTEDYVEIEKVRFAGKLRGRVEVSEELRDIKVPPLSIQSLVENAVKHGITAQRGGGEFAVIASLDGVRLCIEVSDTGPGFDLKAIRAGGGLDNLVGRLEALYGDSAGLNVVRRDGRCVVQMKLPA